MRTYADMLDEYLTTLPMRLRYWQRYKDRWWRLCGTYTYKGKRELVLANYEKRRKFYGKRRLKRMFLDDNLLLNVLAKEGDLSPWHGSALIVPFPKGPDGS